MEKKLCKRKGDPLVEMEETGKKAFFVVNLWFPVLVLDLLLKNIFQGTYWKNIFHILCTGIMAFFFIGSLQSVKLLTKCQPTCRTVEPY